MEIRLVLTKSDLQVLKNALKEYIARTVCDKLIVNDLLGLIEYQEVKGEKNGRDTVSHKKCG